MKKISILLVLILIFTSCGGSDKAILTIEDTTTTTVQDTTTTTVQDTTTTTVEDTTTTSTTTTTPSTTTTTPSTTTTTPSTTTTFVAPNIRAKTNNNESNENCSNKEEIDKCHYIAVEYDKPQNVLAQEIVVATDVPQTIVDEYYEIQTMLNSVIGSYNRYVTVITTTNEYSQPVFDKLKEIHWDQELNIVNGYLVGAGCLTGSGHWQVFPPDPYALCIMDYDFLEYPHGTKEWNAPLPYRRAIIYHGYAHEYFHRYQRSYHYELNMGNLDSVDTPVWWIEGAAILFPNIWLNQNWQEIKLFKGLSFSDIDVEGVNLDMWYKNSRREAQGVFEDDTRCNNYMMTELDRSYDTSGFCFIGIANAYLAYITSYETVWVDIPKDIYDLTFEGSFQKHTNMTLDEFYDKFNSFMRDGDPDDLPPPGFFPDKPISEIVDFFKYSDS